MPSGDDIRRILDAWPFDSGQINARLIDGDDGRHRLQLRIQLGLLQMETEGRPDGARPHGFESLLDYQLDRVRRYERQTGTTAGFLLTGDECKALRDEAVMYYHRYVGMFVIEQYDAVIRDADRNLDLVDLCRDYAAEEHDQTVLEQTRPHLLTIRCRALASKAVREQNGKAALQIIDRGIEEVRAALHDLGLGERIDESNDIQLLYGMRDALVPKLPGSQRAELEQRLRQALESENYELASILRDELRMMDS